MRAINTRDIETPYIISNSYQIPYIIRENPGEGEILMHSPIKRCFYQPPIYNFTTRCNSNRSTIPFQKSVPSPSPSCRTVTDFLFNETERAIPSSDLSSYVTEESSILNGELAARLPSSRGRGRG